MTWGGPFDWSEFDDFDEKEVEEDFFPVFDPMTGLFTIVERIREYVNEPDDYTPDVIRQVEVVEAYIKHGFEDMEAYLARHNEFYTYLEERSEASA